MSKKTKFLTLFISIILSAQAEISVPIAGVPLENPNPVENLEIDADDNVVPFVPGTEYEDQVFGKDKKAVNLPEEGIDSALKEEISRREGLKSWGITIPNNQDSNGSYERLTSRELLSRFQGEGEHSFSFYYIRDEYDVSDTNGVYQRTYGENVSKAMRGGSVHFSFERYWIHSSVFVGWAMNAGVGLSQGKGSFTSGGVTAEQSNTTFSLWTVPVDIGLVFELPLGRWLKVGVSGGPSVMGLYQHRDDKENREGGKHLRQVSWGYYGRANLKISMSHFMPQQSARNLRAYNMTKMYLTLEARMQDYANFQDDLSISGSSFGLGFAFEYL